MRRHPRRRAAPQAEARRLAARDQPQLLRTPVPAPAPGLDPVPASIRVQSPALENALRSALPVPLSQPAAVAPARPGRWLNRGKGRSLLDRGRGFRCHFRLRFVRRFGRLAAAHSLRGDLCPRLRRIGSQRGLGGNCVQSRRRLRHLFIRRDRHRLRLWRLLNRNDSRWGRRIQRLSRNRFGLWGRTVHCVFSW